ncbi:hypothetical protein ACFLS1_12140 [Verrucomicrobiota bacterium]
MNMKYMSLGTVILTLALMVSTSEAAKKDKTGTEKTREKKESKEIVITGTITKTGSKTMAVYTLTDEDNNKVRLPKEKVKKGEEPKINLEDYVGAKVEVVGTGTATQVGKKKRITLKSIVSIVKVDKEEAEETEEETNPFESLDSE